MGSLFMDLFKKKLISLFLLFCLYLIYDITVMLLQKPVESVTPVLYADL